MYVELILATGSRAGITAPIMNGYYMIGRHAECQIRPKTRSVSRRHCVVWRDNDTFKVLDLESTSGTKINQQRIEPRVWCDLKDGDECELRKNSFSSVDEGERNSTPPKPIENAPAAAALIDSPAHETDPQGDGGTTLANIESEPETVTAGTEMVAGEAWQTFNVADFLASQDEADREQRYDSIRQSHASAVMENPGYDSDDFDSNPFDSGDIDEATPLETDEMTATKQSGSPQPVRSVASPTKGTATTAKTKRGSDRSQSHWQRHGNNAKKVLAGRRLSSHDGLAKQVGFLV